MRKFKKFFGNFHKSMKNEHFFKFSRQYTQLLLIQGRIFGIDKNGMERSFKQHKNGMNNNGTTRMGTILDLGS